MRASLTLHRLRALAPALRFPARRCAARCVASGGGSAPDGGEGGDDGDEADGADGKRPPPRYSKLSLPPEEWAHGLHNPRRALGLRAVSLGMLRLRAGEVR